MDQECAFTNCTNSVETSGQVLEIFESAELGLELEAGDRVSFSENDEIPPELLRQKPVIWHHMRDTIEVRDANNEIISKCRFL